MELSIATNPLPLEKDLNGTIRVGGTRVTLGTVVKTFRNRATCEEIVYQYPSLKLADVYAAISYYLRNQSQVDSYLAKRHEKAQSIRKQIEGYTDSQRIRERLLERRTAQSGKT